VKARSARFVFVLAGRFVFVLGARVVFVLAGPFVFVLAALSAAPLPAASRPETLSPQQWREDLHVLATELPRVHADAFHAISKQEWGRRVADLDAAIPGMSTAGIEVGLMRLVAAVGDGHTSLSPFYRPELGFHAIPARLYRFSDGIYVRAASPEHGDLVGARVVGVGGVPVDEAFRRVAETVSHDNDEGLNLVVPLYFGIPEILNGVGLGDGSSVALALEKDGRRFAAHLPGSVSLDHAAHAGGSLWADPPGWVDARGGAKTPLWLEKPTDLYWMTYLDASKTLYVQYNAVHDKEDETIASFSAKLEAFASSHPVDRLALDVRQNSGGNNYYNASLIRSILHARLDARGKLFLIIGRSTFSAAQNLVNDLRRFGEPTFVGEPTGSRPNQFGDHEPVVLPHSGLVVMVSTVFWQDAGKQNHASSTSPDVPAELSFGQYREGFDPAMDAVLRYRSIAEALAPALETGESAAVADRYRAFKSDPATAWIPTEREINALGYRLLGERRAGLAETILQLNAESHPRSANAFDSLGEVLLSEGKLARARESYARALELGPDNDNARRMLAAIDERIGRGGAKDPGKR
jgi:hypothetical protein